MILRQLFDKTSSTYTYLIADSRSKEALLIDPVREQIDRDIQLIEELGLILRYTIETHLHADHITAGGFLRRRFGSKTVTAARAGANCSDLFVEHMDEITIGATTIEVRRTPGHTSGCVSYILRNREQIYAFTGDALMIRGCGRTDFQEGSAATLYASVHEQLFTLPDHTIVYPGHNYKGMLSSTIGEEKQFNPRLKISNNKEQFIEIMKNLNLSPPKKLAIAVPANQHCGLDPDMRDQQQEELSNIGLYRIIDVRTPEEFTGALGHIEGAELVPLTLLTERAVEWNKQKALLLVCHSGERSNKAYASLKDMGFHDITTLKGGMLAWCQQKST